MGALERGGRKENDTHAKTHSGVVFMYRNFIIVERHRF
jgi:hypothetical protein